MPFLRKGFANYAASVGHPVANSNGGSNSDEDVVVRCKAVNGLPVGDGSRRPNAVKPFGRTSREALRP